MLYKLRLRWYTKYQPEISIALTSGFFASTFGTVTMRTPFSTTALISSIFAFWQLETPQELATAALDTMPCVILVFLLYLPLSANPNHFVIFNLDFHFLLFEPRKISLKHMGFWGFLPINSGINESRGLYWKLRHIQRWRWREWEILEWVPDVLQEWIKDIALSAIEEAWNQRHLNLWMLWLESETIGWLVAIAEKFGWWK